MTSQNSSFSAVAGADRKDQRKIGFDVLKVIGLVCIVLAHTNAPDSIMFLRSFDVPIMVIISGSLFVYSSENKNIAFWPYMKHRFIRLLSPTWAFLVLFFSLTFVIFSLMGKPYPFSAGQIASSFALLKGIGYVWIIRVFILVAMIAPLLLKIHRQFMNNYFYLLLLMMCYICYEILYKLVGTFDNIVIDTIMQQIIFYLLPYACLFGLGLSLPNMSKKTLSILAASFLLVLSGVVIYNYYFARSLNIAQYKYPPQLYYVTYGTIISLLLYRMVSDESITNKYMVNTITFMSSFSLWIYLWHIFFLYCLNIFAYRLLPIMGKFPASFAIVLSLSIITTYLQKRIVTDILSKTRAAKKNIDLIASLFLK